MLRGFFQKGTRQAILSVAVALITAVLGFAAGAGEHSGKSQRIYDVVMDWVGDYGQLNEPKVMATCIDWDASNESGFYVHNVFVTYTAEGSDRPIFTGKLAQNSLYRCKKWAKSEKIDCTCQMLDKNGKNVLRVPAGVDQFLPQREPDKPDIKHGMAGIGLQAINFTTGIRNAQPVDDLTSIRLSEGSFYIHVKWAVDLNLVQQFLVRYQVFDGQSNLVSNGTGFYAPESRYWNTWRRIPLTKFNAPGQWRVAIYVIIGPDETKIVDTYLTVLPD